MLFHYLLYNPLPDQLPTDKPVRPSRAPRSLIKAMINSLSAAENQDDVDRRVRRGAVQAIVRTAYQNALAEQDSAHLKPDAFAASWQAHLAEMLGQPSVEVTGWGEITIEEVDTGLAWQLFTLTSRARHDVIEHAAATPSVPQQRRHHEGPGRFSFTIASEDSDLGDVVYGVCEECRTGLLYKIEFPPDWQFCGFGRLGLQTLEARHPELTWYTTGQFAWSQGFYDRYRQTSSSPWTVCQHPCPHFR